MEIRKRICELKVGEQFDLRGSVFEVYEITEAAIHYCTPNRKAKFQMGRKSQQFVFMQVKKKEIKIHEVVKMKRPDAVYSNSGHWDLVR